MKPHSLALLFHLLLPLHHIPWMHPSLVKTPIPILQGLYKQLLQLLSKFHLHSWIIQRNVTYDWPMQSLRLFMML